MGVVTQIVDIGQTAQFITSLANDSRRQNAIAKAGKSYAKKATKRPDEVAAHIAALQQGAQS